MSSLHSNSLNPSTEDDERTMSEINTTPLVDVMLVLLIVFMITIPVITKTVPLDLPVVRKVFWNQSMVNGNDDLLERFDGVARMQPQPEVHVRADQRTKYEYVGRVIVDAQRKGIMKVGFITEPDAPGAPQG
jgi:biopolymer transport protein ExbD